MMQNENGANSAALSGTKDEVVARTLISGFRTDVLAAGHAMIADEPTSLGGTDLGPTPYDLLGAALATCTTMTLRMYASRKGLDLQSITVRVKHGKVHATDCRDCETTVGKIDEFQRSVSFEGTLSEEQTTRLLQIADMCPVHRTLHNEVKIRTQLE